mmetsp:Transcript_15617/g.46084  ORF Transcript_15617/g.46084 Transcript_15617/m.46084 type:complete len:276 (+) Transcript_15617:541-1368(+)
MMLAAMTVPSTLVAPTASDASVSDVTPAVRNTLVEKKTSALMPASCWNANSRIPILKDFWPKSSPTDTSAAGPPLPPLLPLDISEPAALPQSCVAALSASSFMPLDCNQRGLSGHASIPRASAAAGTAPIRNMVRHDSAGRTTLTPSAVRMPTQIMSWFSVPRAPRIAVGAISLMYVGTSAEDSPIAIPVMKRPTTIVEKLPEYALSSGPSSIGAHASSRPLRRPSESDTLPPDRLPAAAPASVLLTTTPLSAASPPMPRSIAIASSGPLTTPRW